MTRILISVAIMALVTYLIRMLPLTLFTKKIKSRWLQDFLYYTPYAVLASLTFPGIFYATGNMTASLVGTGVAVVMAWLNFKLLPVAIGAVISALFVLLLI
ncbi:MAG: AzlD domain-containing protein [Eubacterium sp.]|nr:AzlD domain-containing protein [Eubacterium sp.]